VETQAELREFLEGSIPPSPTIANPVDLVWAPSLQAASIYIRCLEIITKVVDISLVITYVPLSNEAFAAEVQRIRDKEQKPIIIVPGHPTEEYKGLSLFTQRGIPSFPIPDRAVKAISALARYSQYRHHEG